MSKKPPIASFIRKKWKIKEHEKRATRTQGRQTVINLPVKGKGDESTNCPYIPLAGYKINNGLALED
jgi:hypothetical protein